MPAIKGRSAKSSKLSREIMVNGFKGKSMQRHALTKYREPADDLLLTPDPSRLRIKICRVISRMRHMATGTHARGKRLARALRKENIRNKEDQRMHKPVPPWRGVVYAKDLAAYAGIHICTAQRKLRETRLKLGKKKNRYVSPKEFCRINDVDYETFQEFLNYRASLGKDDENDDEVA